MLVTSAFTVKEQYIIYASIILFPSRASHKLSSYRIQLAGIISLNRGYCKQEMKFQVVIYISQSIRACSASSYLFFWQKANKWYDYSPSFELFEVTKQKFIFIFRISPLLMMQCSEASVIKSAACIQYSQTWQECVLGEGKSHMFSFRQFSVSF